MLPRKNIQNLQAVMAILVLFEQFSRKFCLNFLTLILSALPNMMHFVITLWIMHTFDYACLRRKAYRYLRSLKLWKNCKHQRHI